MKLRLLFTIFVVLLGGVLIYQKAPSGDFEDGQGTRVEKEDLIQQEFPPLPKTSETKIVETKQEVFTPGPLKTTPPPAPALMPTPPASPPPPAPQLTTSGIVLQTNLQRQQNGLAYLTANGTLNAMALHKVNDMCEKQYFAHTSPAGVGAGDLADTFGYNYILIGENLAFGPFSNDAGVVEAWMNSPGHRANILNSKFTEMGAAAVRCILEGKNTWLAVQHFGKPASDCPGPDAALLKSINEKKAAITDLKNKIIVLKAEIEAADSSDSSYPGKVNSYNSMVKEYNNLITETKAIINQYNNQVSVFNVCASQ